MIQLTIILFWLSFRRGQGSGSGKWVREVKGKKQPRNCQRNLTHARKQKGLPHLSQKSGREIPGVKVKFIYIFMTS